MELRHLRCFVVLAEELHFTRAAERLHIEQPPLSRAIKELEDELGVTLFDRDRRGTRLTVAGAAFLQDTRRLFTVLEQARENARAIAAGLRGSLRIAISDGAMDPRLSAFLARCRAEEPEVEIRLSEVPLTEQIRGLRSGDFTIGFAHAADVGEGIVAEPIWRDPIVIAVPARHSLLAHKQVPLNELQGHPLVLCDKLACEGYCRETKSAATGSGTQAQRCRRSVVAGHDANAGRRRLWDWFHDSDQDSHQPEAGRGDSPSGAGHGGNHNLSASARKQQLIGFAGSLHGTSARTSG